MFELKRLVSLSYAILQSERGKGYAKQVLRSISELLLSDLNSIQLIVDKENRASQRTALSANFRMYQSQKQTSELDFYTYEKTKTMLEQERHYK